MSRSNLWTLFIVLVVSTVIALFTFSYLYGADLIRAIIKAVLEDWFAVEPFTWAGIGSCLLAGSIMGWERELKNKPVGMRTCILIVLGTYAFIVLSNYSLQQMPESLNSIVDPSRIIGQVMSGIGFLGGGVILARKGNWQGVTSAATVWLLAAIGVCAGLGLHLVSVKLSIIGIVILIVVDTYNDQVISSSKKVFKRKK